MKTAPIHPHFASAGHLAAKGAPQFAGWRDYIPFLNGGDEGDTANIKQNAGKAADEGEGFNIGQRIKDGLNRVFRMTLLRPTGLLELALFHSWAFALSWMLPLKHFMEGFLHVDSMVLPRMPSPFGFFSKHRQYGRSLIGMLQGKPDQSAAA